MGNAKSKEGSKAHFGAGVFVNTSKPQTHIGRVQYSVNLVACINLTAQAMFPDTILFDTKLIQ